MNTTEKSPAQAVSLVRYAETTSLFTLHDLRHRYGKNMGDSSLYSIVYKLKRAGRVRAVCPGVYSGASSTVPVDRYALPGKLRSDAVIGFHSALEFHGVTNQVFQTVHYLSVRPHCGVFYQQVRYHRVAPSRRLVRLGRTQFQVQTSPSGVRVSSRERSLVDCLHSLEYSGGVDEVDRCLAMFPSFSFDAALEYLKLLRSPWLYARVGYLLDRHAQKLFFTGKWRDAFLRRVPRSVVYLDRKRPGCRWVSTWNLMAAPALAKGSEEGTSA